MSKTKELTDYLAHPRPVMAWTILILSIVFNGYAMTLQLTTVELSEKLSDLFQIPVPQLTYTQNAFFYAFFLMQIPVGILVDRFGSRKIPSLAILTCAAGALVFSFSQSLLMVGVGRALMGIGGSFAFLNGLKIVSNWFYSKRFAFMLGMFIGLSVLSMIILGESMLSLQDALGWRQALLVFSLIGLILGCLFFFIVQDAPGAGFSVHTGQQRATFGYFIRKVFQNGQNWIVSLTAGFVIGPLFAFRTTWSKEFLLLTYRFSETTAELMNMFFLAGYAIGAPFFARISTSIRRRKLFIVWGIVGAILMLLLIIYPPYLGVQSLAICYVILGLSVSTINLGYVIVHELNVPRIGTTALGISNVFFGAFCAISQILIVTLFQIGLLKSYEIASSASMQISLLRIPIYLFIGLIFSLFIKETRAKQLYSYDVT
ncbi:MFS transporter [Simkania sp.]|uniref:MFS transporter n=1 Tax=Simkania sp. TaxID=34094 RepID=UPI003B52A01F